MAGRADRARPAHERWCITVIRFPFTTNFRCMAATVQTLYSENRLLTPAKSGSRKHGAPPISQQPEPSERLLDRCDLLWRAWIVFGCDSRFHQTKLLFAVQNPRALRNETMLARDSLLDFLVAYTLGWLPSMPGWVLIRRSFFRVAIFYFTRSFNAAV
jgi:hypothetical protein